MGFSRQEYWSGLPFPAPGDPPNPVIELMSLFLLHWQVDFSLVPSGKHMPILSLLVPGKLKHFPKFPSCLSVPYPITHTDAQEIFIKKSYQFTLLLKTLQWFSIESSHYCPSPCVSFKTSYKYTIVFSSRLIYPIPPSSVTYNSAALDYVQFPKHVLLPYFCLIWLLNFVH